MSETRQPLRIVVTGANRGIGLAYARHSLEAGDRVWALARQPDQATELQQLQQRFPSTLATAACDVRDDASVRAAADRVASQTDALDVLLNNAGVGDRASNNLDSIDWQRLIDVFDVNALGPLRVTRALLPLLRAGRSPRVVNLTSLMGSISDNRSGGAYGYRMSKAALNMATANLAHELGPSGITSVVVHPGWVQTDMGGSRAPLPVDDAVDSLIRTVTGLKPDQNGAFLDRDGKPLPW